MSICQGKPDGDEDLLSRANSLINADNGAARRAPGAARAECAGGAASWPRRIATTSDGGQRFPFGSSDDDDCRY
jgi:hypothetical protein